MRKILVLSVQVFSLTAKMKLENFQQNIKIRYNVNFF